VKVLVTGASGFVGRHTVRHLINQRDWHVRALRGREARMLATKSDGIEYSSPRSIDGNTAWDDAIDGVDAVLHLAARVHVLSDNADAAAAFQRVNVEGTVRLASAAKKARVKHFVFVSSIGVNGNQTLSEPFSEQSPPAPIGPYARSKWEAEQALAETLKRSGTALTIIRPPLIYGPGAPGNCVRLRKLAEKGLPLPIGRVSNKRSVISVANLDDFFVHVLENPAARDELFLVSDGEDVSTPDLLRKIAHAMNRSSRLLPFPVPILKAAATAAGKRNEFERLTASLQVDSSKARELLGWKPVESLDQGIHRWITEEYRIGSDTAGGPLK
jgi:nucleoside-diphosphate-sugar epimerase